MRACVHSLHIWFELTKVFILQFVAVCCSTNGSSWLVLTEMCVRVCVCVYTQFLSPLFEFTGMCAFCCAARSGTYVHERWGAGVETQKNVRGEIGGWGRVPFNEPYAPSLSTIYDGA